MLLEDKNEQLAALLARHNALVIEHAVLLINNNALVEAVKKYFKSERLEILKREARAEVDRLIASDDCKGEG